MRDGEALLAAAAGGAAVWAWLTYQHRYRPVMREHRARATEGEKETLANLYALLQADLARRTRAARSMPAAAAVASKAPAASRSSCSSGVAYGAPQPAQLYPAAPRDAYNAGIAAELRRASDPAATAAARQAALATASAMAHIAEAEGQGVNWWADQGWTMR